MAKGPQFTRYILPILHVLRQMGGSATAAEVTDAVIEREDLSEELLEQTNKNGQSKVRNQIAWARMYLVHSGRIDSSIRGVWRLAEKGQHEDIESINVASLFKGVQSTFKANSGDVKPAKSAESVEEAESRFEAEETALLPVIKSLSPEGFERLCQRLLREHGFQN
jgi:restriction system protein